MMASPSLRTITLLLPLLYSRESRSSGEDLVSLAPAMKSVSETHVPVTNSHPSIKVDQLYFQREIASNKRDAQSPYLLLLF